MYLSQEESSFIAQSLGNVAVVILCNKADEANLQAVHDTAKLWAQHNSTDEQVHVVIYGSSLEKQHDTACALQEVDLGNAVYRFHQAYDKRSALKECAARLSQHYTHIMVVNAKARFTLRHEAMDMSAACAYHARPQSSRRNLMPLMRGMSSRRGFSSGNTAANKPTTWYKPNHYLDLWERNTLMMHLRTQRPLKEHANNTVCPLDQVISQNVLQQPPFVVSAVENVNRSRRNLFSRGRSFAYLLRD